MGGIDSKNELRGLRYLFHVHLGVLEPLLEAVVLLRAEDLREERLVALDVVLDVGGDRGDELLDGLDRGLVLLEVVLLVLLALVADQRQLRAVLVEADVLDVLVAVHVALDVELRNQVLVDDVAVLHCMCARGVRGC